MRRRPDRGMLLLLPPLLFDRPAQFALVATVLVFGGAALMFGRSTT